MGQGGEGNLLVSLLTFSNPSEYRAFLVLLAAVTFATGEFREEAF